MNNVIVCGGCGKMASLIAKLIYQDDTLELVGVVESSKHPAIGQDWGIVNGIGKTEIIIEDNLDKIIEKCDVVVDFTNPEATMNNLIICSKHKKACVIGTTGLSENQVKNIRESSENIPIVFSPNMALGVNLLFDLAKKVAAVLDAEYDIEIIETHHRYKKDAPSGTAMKIAEIIANERGVKLDKSAIYGRCGNIGARNKGEIGIHAIRAGNISGEHTIIFNSLGERLELTHKAYSRDAFAEGAVKAINFILNKKKGLFSTKEVLNL
ncbi:MAG: 4-hydroxy-tetrahydrodipicolinate reductase [Candidatus Caldatribacteriota bacterium]|jgi:4-hydroxy-tetrahydrodipicolinate reductase